LVSLKAESTVETLVVLLEYCWVASTELLMADASDRQLDLTMVETKEMNEVGNLVATLAKKMAWMKAALKVMKVVVTKVKHWGYFLVEVLAFWWVE
jgi:hypothetical protein